MDKRIKIRYEGKRGCGYRKKEALYIVNFDGAMAPCGKMPVALDVCPACGEGIKPARAVWTWVDGDVLLKEAIMKTCSLKVCPSSCPLSAKALVGGEKFGQVGLTWIGERHYPTPADFMREAAAMGISRRIKTIPKGFELGKTWALLAHRLTIPATEKGKEATAGIFFMYQPTAIEYVCKGTETKEEIDALTKRGLTPVMVENPPKEAPPEEKEWI